MMFCLFVNVKSKHEAAAPATGDQLLTTLKLNQLPVNSVRWEYQSLLLKISLEEQFDILWDMLCFMDEWNQRYHSHYWLDMQLQSAAFETHSTIMQIYWKIWASRPDLCVRVYM